MLKNNRKKKTSRFEIIDTPCGGCTACCEIMGVAELRKPFYTRCSFCNEGQGCSTYEAKPKDCTGFGCLYSMGLVLDRPDQCGIMFTFDKMPDGKITLDVYEVTRDVFKKSFGWCMRIVDAIARKMNRTTDLLQFFRYGTDIPNEWEGQHRRTKMWIPGRADGFGRFSCRADRMGEDVAWWKSILGKWA